MRRFLLPAVLAAVGVVVLLVGIPGVAQVPTFEGEEVIVPGRRVQRASTTPAYVTVIPREELLRMGFQTLGDALQFLSEVYVRTAGAGPGGLQQASIRGSTPQQVMVLLDGIPLSAASQFGVNLSTIPLADVERVEVLRGPYSAIHGSGALGGVIQVITRGARRERSTEARAGSRGSLDNTLRVSGQSPLSYAITLQRLSTGGDRPNADARRMAGSGRFTRLVGPRVRLTLLVHHTAGVSGLPGPLYFPTPQDRLADGRTALSLTWESGEAEDETTLIRAWWVRERLGFTSPYFSSASVGDAYGLQWQRVTRLRGEGLLTWGVDVQRAVFALNDQSPYGGTGLRSQGITTAGFVQYDVALGRRVLAGMGMRLDYDSAYGAQLDPRAGFVYAASPRLHIRGSVGRTFRGPSFGELFYPGCSNPALRPERAWAADLGLEATVRPGLLARLNGFLTDAQDLIVGGCNPQNVGAARVAGISAEMVGRLSGPWLVNGNVTWASGVDRATGQRLLRLPSVQASLVVRRLLAGGSHLSLLAAHVGDRDDLDFSIFPARRVTLRGYATVGLRYEHPLGGSVLRVGIDNVLDARYETQRGFPGPGRMFYVQLGMGF